MNEDCSTRDTLIEASTVIKLLCTGRERFGLLTPGQITIVENTLEKISNLLSAISNKPTGDCFECGGVLFPSCPHWDVCGKISGKE